MLTGVFRDEEQWVRVRYDSGREIDMPRERYITLRLEPTFESLPLEGAASPSCEEEQSRALPQPA